MKKIILTSLTLIVLITSCKKKSTPDPEDSAAVTTTGTTTTGTTTVGTVNTGPLVIYVIDTAKVNTITETGTNETTIINKTINTSSYIMNFSAAIDGTKLVYGISQSNFSGSTPVYTKELRISNNNGSNDGLLYSIPEGTAYIGSIRAGLNNKVYYTVQGAANILYSINTDATGNTQLFSWPAVIDDISTNGIYLISKETNFGYNRVNIVDRTGDGGAGGIHYTENFLPLSASDVGHGCFSYDTQKAFIPYNDGGTLKLKVIDMTAKSSVSKTITTISGSFPTISAKVAGDGDRVVVTVSTAASSVSYIYKVSANSFTSFTNNDSYVTNVYPF